MKYQSTQHGFSLLELLISMAISLIALIAAVGFMSKFARTAGAFTEVSTMEEARGSSETLLRADFDGAGRNLTRPSPPLAGTIFATPTSFDNYTWSNGTITKTGSTGWNSPATITHTLAGGLGSFSFTPPANGGSILVYGPGGASFAIVFGSSSQGSGLPVTVYINGVETTAPVSNPPSQALSPHLANDSYVFKIENSTSTRVGKLYRIRNNTSAVVWPSAPVPSYPIAFQVNIYNQGQSFTNVKITGAPLVLMSGNQTEFVPLPSDNNTPLTGPITITGGGSGAILLSGDRNTDSVTTLATFQQNSTQILARAPARGSYTIGDFVLVIDWGSLDPANPGGAASSLCLVTAVSGSTSDVTLTIQRVRKTNAAWARLWSSDADHAHTFNSGSTLTKLQTPITYALSSDNRLVRVQGDRVSSLAFNVRRATFTRFVEANSVSWIYQVDITLAAEGVETNPSLTEETRGTIEFASRPRALNLASNQLN